MRHKKQIQFIQRLQKHKLLLPPLAEYTDYPFRKLLAGFDPPFICTEMVSAEAIIQGSQKTMQMLQKTEGTHLSGAQLLGSDPDSMSKAAVIVESLGYDYIDINMGCTVRTVTCNGAGVSLMKDEEKSLEIASAVEAVVGIPVTCKIRLGASKMNMNAVSLSKNLVDAGVSAITVHGRSGEKKFGFPVDYDGIKEVVEAVEVPVVANGGIYTGRQALEVLKRTGASAVMPGRGLIGNPWLILEIRSALDGAAFSSPSLQERREVCLMHLAFLCDCYGEQKGVRMMRRVLGKYFTGIRHVNALKLDVHKATSVKQVEELLDRFSEDDSDAFYERRG
ncbi:MAG: tRNA-dihydrouridine synthase [Candidatus Bathyarchaeota archaeon]|nr:tRNA-dihydrouridine synthase [Candidatus Bathyarchaeota archaeon]